MMRSMFSGVSGLKSHQTKLDVIGNNIANVNTVGYKSSRVTFQEVFSQTVRGAGAPDTTTGRGGTNPMQVGLGMGVAAVDTVFTRGSVQRTDNSTDLSIDGDGLFIVKGGSDDSYCFTRAGDFTVDKMGNFVTSSGGNIYGWQYHTSDPNNPGTEVYDTEKAVEPINIYSDSYNGNKKIIAPSATDEVALSGNLNMNDTPTDDAIIVPLTVFDAYGNEYEAEVQFQKSATDHVWNYTVSDTEATPRFADVTGTITFDTTAGNEGKALTATGGANAPGTPVPALKRMITLGLNAVDASLTNITYELDFGKITQYATDSSAKAYSVNGYNSGTLSSFSIGSDGVITGIYSNGQQQPLGLIALANFENPSGLQKVGDNLYRATTNSGEFKKGVKPGAEGLGTLNPGTLEMSNVDLSSEFTEMITTQRGFQANSRIITTSDEILQELVNIKR
ncbi:MAG: flagellar hook protein FlgE [Ignavibacteriales bacterium]